MNMHVTHVSLIQVLVVHLGPRARPGLDASIANRLLEGRRIDAQNVTADVENYAPHQQVENTSQRA